MIVILVVSGARRGFTYVHRHYCASCTGCWYASTCVICMYTPYDDDHVMCVTMLMMSVLPLACHGCRNQHGADTSTYVDVRIEQLRVHAC